MIGEFGKIKRMKRLAQLVKNVVGDVSYVVDRPLANLVSRVATIAARGPILTSANDPCSVTRARSGSLISRQQNLPSSRRLLYL